MTDELARHRIRHELDESLIVEAAAGTGKTTELVHRIVNTLRSGKTTVDRIVAVTFTRKAAGELRLRLRIELDAARNSITNAEETRHLENALSRLEEAHIGTIHSFCTELLRQRPVEARIPPGFEELDENQSARLYRRAFDSWIQEALQRMPDGLRRALSRTAATPTTDGTSPLDQIRFAGQMLVEWRDFPKAWRRSEFDQHDAIDRLIPEVDELAAMVSTCTVANDPLRKHLQCVTDFVSRLRRSEQIRPRDYDELEALLIQMGRALRRYHQKGRTKKYSNEYSRDEILKAMGRFQSSLDEFQRHSDADLAALLQSELRGLVDQYEDLKARSGKLDFVDLLIRVRNLIRENDDVRRFMQSQFTHIFVDEFQDTDPVQAEILVLLSADDPAETDWRRVRPKSGKLFLVGDPKQSIYRFRRADILMYQDLCRQLCEKGVATVYLSRSFRSLRPIQEAVNAAFAPEMTGDVVTGQPSYVALENSGEDGDGGEQGGQAKRGTWGQARVSPGAGSGVPRITFGTPEPAPAGTPVPVPMFPASPVPMFPPSPISQQPSVIALPVPDPYGYRNISNQKIEKCLPDTVAAFIDWLIHDSGWKVRDPATNEPIPVASQHVAILFRRFMSWGSDVTRPYVHALEARNVPHLLWGARSFHQREEIETVRAALNAIEWPDDELSVYATLRGSLFAISDNLLLRYRHGAGSSHPFHPFRPTPPDLGPDFAPITEALAVIADLHRRRNRRGIVETVNAVLEAARAHAAFALRPSGNQVLANVYRICDLARSYELADGYSFRGFVERLNEQSEREDSSEAPVLEEGTEGVRIMTVHSAKGLEFPVVILADMTANIASRNPDKHVNVGDRLCAIRLLGCSPWDLIDHEEEEHNRDAAEGVRVAYVAATRARDLLVVTAVGDGPRDGWLSPLNKTIYPAKADYRASVPAPGCPPFGETSVLQRPMDFDGTSEISVRPGLHGNVVWWDPALLRLEVEASFGLRREEILIEENERHAAESLSLYTAWQSSRQQALDSGVAPSLNIFLATDGLEPPTGFADRVQVDRVRRSGPRPRGARFGTLVHAILRDVDFKASLDSISRLARTHSRLLNAPIDEIEAATAAVAAALRHPLLVRARKATRVYRELPLLLRHPAAGMLEAVLDLVFVEDTVWTVIDFKTDAEDPLRVAKYRRQVGWYLHALETTQRAAASAWLLHL